MNHLIFNKDDLLLEWCASQLPYVGRGADFGPARAIGVATGKTKTDRLMAVVVFHDYRPSYRTCQISMAATDPRWASRRTIRDILAFPFYQYGVNKVWVSIPHTSPRVIKFVKAIGFTQEAVLKEHFGRGVHCVVCRLMFHEYERRYLKKDAIAA